MVIAKSFRGAIIGDCTGSAIEGAHVSDDPFPGTRIVGNKFPEPRTDRTGEILGSMPLIVDGCRPTDDTALSCAVAEYLMFGGNIASNYRKWSSYNEFPAFDFGKGFRRWTKGKSSKHATSSGNGCAMRIGPLVDGAKTQKELLTLVDHTVRPTHDHPQALLYAKLIALAGFLTKEGASKKTLSAALLAFSDTALDLETPLAQIRPRLTFSTEAEATVPLAILAYLEAHSFEDAIRRALSLGHDTDTIAAMTGIIAAARWPIPETLWNTVGMRLPARVSEVLYDFEEWLSITSVDS